MSRTTSGRSQSRISRDKYESKAGDEKLDETRGHTTLFHAPTSNCDQRVCDTVESVDFNNLRLFMANLEGYVNVCSHSIYFLIISKLKEHIKVTLFQNFMH